MPTTTTTAAGDEHYWWLQQKVVCSSLGHLFASNVWSLSLASNSSSSSRSPKWSAPSPLPPPLKPLSDFVRQSLFPSGLGVVEKEAFGSSEWRPKVRNKVLPSLTHSPTHQNSPTHLLQLFNYYYILMSTFDPDKLFSSSSRHTERLGAFFFIQTAAVAFLFTSLCVCCCCCCWWSWWCPFNAARMMFDDCCCCCIKC